MPRVPVGTTKRLRTLGSGRWIRPLLSRRWLASLLVGCFAYIHARYTPVRSSCPRQALLATHKAHLVVDEPVLRALATQALKIRWIPAQLSQARSTLRSDYA